MIKLEFKTRGKIITRYEVFSNGTVAFITLQASSVIFDLLSFPLLPCTTQTQANTLDDSVRTPVSILSLLSDIDINQLIETC